MDTFKIYKRRFRLDDGELWHRIDGFYGYPAFAVRTGLFENKPFVRKTADLGRDFAMFVAEHGVQPLLSTYIEGEVRLLVDECGPVWARDDDPCAHYFKVYVKERTDYDRLCAHISAFDWPDRYY